MRQGKCGIVVSATEPNAIDSKWTSTKGKIHRCTNVHGKRWNWDNLLCLPYLRFLLQWHNAMTKCNLGRTRLYSILSHHPWKSGQELKAETWSQELIRSGGEMLLTCLLSWLSQFPFLYAQNHWPRVVLSLPTSPLIRKTPVGQSYCIQVSLTEVFSQLWLHLLR